MSRTHTAGYMLLASAFILTALIFVQASRPSSPQRAADGRSTPSIANLLESTAHGEMVVTKDFVTLLTAQYQGDNEVLYLLDAKSEMLLVYLVNPSRNEIQLLPGGVMNVGQAFDRYLNAGNAGDDADRGIRDRLRRR